MRRLGDSDLLQFCRIFLAGPLPANPNYDYYSVAALEDTVWVAGTHGFVFVSRNEGNSWLIESTYVSSTIRSIFIAAPMLSPTPGFPLGDAYAVGDSGTILHSTNNGQTWVRQPSGTTENLYGVVFTDSLTGTIVGANGTILHTTTGGSPFPVLSLSTTQLVRPGRGGSNKKRYLVSLIYGPAPLIIFSVFPLHGPRFAA